MADKQRVLCPTCGYPSVMEATEEEVAKGRLDLTGAELETVGVLSEAGVEAADWTPPVLEAWESVKAKLVTALASLAAVAVEDDGPKFYGWDHPADEDEEAPSGRPVPAGEGADAGPQEEET